MLDLVLVSKTSSTVTERLEQLQTHGENRSDNNEEGG